MTALLTVAGAVLAAAFAVVDLLRGAAREMAGPRR